jgi:RNA 3'-terminal phosphate cyclase
MLDIDRSLYAGSGSIVRQSVAYAALRRLAGRRGSRHGHRRGHRRTRRHDGYEGGARLGADRAGAPHRRAERIGTGVARQLLDDIAAGATVDRNTADQILRFAALAGGTSRYRVPFVSPHVDTGEWLASLFLGVEVSVDDHTVSVPACGGG